MGVRNWTRFCCGVAFSLAITPSFAQENTNTAVAVLDSDELSESFDTAKVSASTLVGVKFGTFEGFVDVEQVVVAVPENTPDKICVQIRTQDARYSALNRYRIGVGAVLSKVKLLPITKRFRANLERYKKTALAVKGFASKKGVCNPYQALILPQLSNVQFKKNSLVVMVNSESRIAIAELYKKPVSVQASEPVPKPFARATCDQYNENAAVAFDKICKLTISGNIPEGPVFLRVLLDDGFGVDPQDFSVFLPSAKKLSSSK